MKKMLLVLMMVFGLVLSANAETMIGSGSKAADTLIQVGSGNFYGIAIATDATNAVTVSIYDNTTNSGKLIVPTFIATTGASDRTKSFFVYPAVRYETGIYVDITCAGTVGFEVYYAQ
jgi:hypothetical protein